MEEAAFKLDFFLCHHTISNSLSLPGPHFLLLSVIGNSLVLVSGLVLFSCFSERPSVPFWVWVSVYALHYIIRLFVLSLRYHYTRVRIHDDAAADHRRGSQSKMKRLESMNAIMLTVWWIIGFYCWIVSDRYSLSKDSPILYWLTTFFLAFNSSFIMYCIIAAFIAFLVVFGYLPNLPIALRKGASEDDIRCLPKYKNCQDNSSTTLAIDIKQGTTEPEESSQVISIEETGERSNVAEGKMEVKKMTVGGDKEEEAVAQGTEGAPSQTALM